MTRWLVLAALLVCGVAAVTGPGLVATPDRVPGRDDSDCNLLFYANRAFFQRSVAAGELPLWNPHDLLGYPQFAAGQTGIFYPPNYALYPWMTTGHALFADIALHLVLLGLTTASLAWWLGLSTAGGLVAGAGVALSPLLILRVHAGHLTVISTLAWIPAIAQAFLSLASGEGRSRTIAAGALAFGLALHAGHIQPLYYVVVFGIPPLALASVWRRDLHALGRIALAAALGGAIGALQLLPMAELASISSRTGTSVEWVLRHSTRPVDLAALLGVEFFGDRAAVPFWGRSILWETAPAFGFVLFLLASMAPLVSPSARTRVLLALALLGWILAMGLDLPLQRLACAVVPGFSSFRAHSRLLLVVLLPVGLLAGCAVDALVARTDRGRGALALGLAALGLGLAGAAVAGHGTQPERWADLVGGLSSWEERITNVNTRPLLPAIKAQVVHVLARASALALSLAGLVAVSRVRPLGLAGTAAVLLLLAIELADGSLKLAVTSPAPAVDPATRVHLLARPANARVHFGRSYMPTLPTLLGMDSAGGSVSLMSRWTLMLLRAVQGQTGWDEVSDTVRLHRFDGLARMLGTAVSVDSPATGWVPPGLAAVATAGPDRVYIEPAPWPRAWCVPRATWAADGTAAVAALLDPAFDPAAEAVLEGEPRDLDLEAAPRRTDGEARLEARAAAPLAATVVARTANTLRLRASMERPGVLVVADAYDPGWTAYVGGTRVDVLRANVALRGVPFPAGEHEVLLVYRPRTLHVAGVIAACAALIVWRLFRRSGGDNRSGDPRWLPDRSPERGAS